MTLLGGAPGAGKTALHDANCSSTPLRLTPTFALSFATSKCGRPCCSTGSWPGCRESTCRRSGTGGLARNTPTASTRHLNTLEPLAERLAFVRPPFDLANVAATADAFGAQLLLLDYIQRIPPPGEHSDKRGSVNATMDYLRQFADAGTAVIVVSAVGRTKDNRGGQVLRRRAEPGVFQGVVGAGIRDRRRLLVVPDDDQGDAVTIATSKAGTGRPRHRLDFRPQASAIHAGRRGPGTAAGRREGQVGACRPLARTPPAADDAEGGDERMTPRIIAVGEEPPPMDAAAAGEPLAGQARRGSRPARRAKAGERFAVLNAFVDFALADLSRAEIAVWLVLFRDTRDGTARTSYDDLARRAGCNRRSRPGAARAGAAGLFKIVHRGGLGRGPSRYRVRGPPKDG